MAGTLLFSFAAVAANSKDAWAWFSYRDKTPNYQGATSYWYSSSGKMGCTTPDQNLEWFIKVCKSSTTSGVGQMYAEATTRYLITVPYVFAYAGAQHNSGSGQSPITDCLTNDYSQFKQKVWHNGQLYTNDIYAGDAYLESRIISYVDADCGGSGGYVLYKRFLLQTWRETRAGGEHLFVNGVTLKSPIQPASSAFYSMRTDHRANAQSSQQDGVQSFADFYYCSSDLGSCRVRTDLMRVIWCDPQIDCNFG